jgi:hypothetical protein
MHVYIRTLYIHTLTQKHLDSHIRLYITGVYIRLYLKGVYIRVYITGGSRFGRARKTYVNSCYCSCTTTHQEIQNIQGIHLLCMYVCMYICIYACVHEEMQSVHLLCFGEYMYVCIYVRVCNCMSMYLYLHTIFHTCHIVSVRALQLAKLLVMFQRFPTVLCNRLLLEPRRSNS